MLRSLRQCAALFCAVLFLQGCATSSSINVARSQFFSGQTQVALDTLNSKSVSERDLLLAHLDRGLIAHTSGDYQLSVNAFLSAVALLEEFDYLSVREQSAKLVTNDSSASYKGEYSERLWIHTFQMMNFLLLNNPSAAAVEARQALKVLDKHNNSLNGDWYTRALIALSFEAARRPDSAHIEYKKLLNDMAGSQSSIARRAWQNAKRLGRTDDAELFKSYIETSASVGNDNGEFILFLQTGAIARKSSGEILIDEDLYASFPVYPERYRSSAHIERVSSIDNTSEALASEALESVGESDSASEPTVNVDEIISAGEPVEHVQTHLLDISRKALAARGTQITITQALRLAAKKGIADAISDENEILGALATVFFYATEQADTRSWETLPAQLSMVQIPLAPGTHSLNFNVRVDNKLYELKLDDITIEPRQTSFRSIRLGSGASRDHLLATSENKRALPPATQPASPAQSSSEAATKTEPRLAAQ